MATGLAQALSAGLRGAAAGLDQRRADQRQDKLDNQRDEDRQFDLDRRAQERKRWADENERAAALKSVDELARGAYQTAMQPGPDGKAPDQTQGMLAALEARTKALADTPGASAEWLKSWADTANLRGQVRSAQIQAADEQYRLTGDPSAYIGVYNQFKDGATAKSLRKLPDGSVELVRERDGKEETKVMSAEDFQRGTDFLRNPKLVMEMEAKLALADAKHQALLKEIAERNKGSKDVAETRARGTITAAQIRAAAQKSGGGGKGGGGGSGAFKTETLADGRILLTFRDGTQRIAVDDDGNPFTSAKALDQALTGTKIVAGSLSGMQNTPEESARQGARLVRGLSQQVGTPPAKPAAGNKAGTTTSTGKPVGSYWGD